MRTARLLVLVFIGLIVLLPAQLGAYESPIWISFDGSPPGEKPSAVVQRSDNQETIIEFQVKGMIVEDIVEEGETYQTLRFPHYHTTLEIGRPQLPIITEMVGIPGTANVRAVVVDAAVVTLKNYNVYPFQTPLVEEEKRTQFDIDKDLYAQNAFYPKEIVEIGKPSIWRDIRVADVRVCPVRFNPVTRELEVYEKLTVKLEYYGKSDVNILVPSERPIPSQYEKMYRSIILNYDYLDLPKGTGEPIDGRRPNQDYDYLIIAVDRFVGELGDLETWKESQGILTEVTPLSSIGATANAIKTHIIQEYTNNHIKWVLLVGDIAELPTFTGYSYRYGNILSDYWYALLTGNDLLPEISVGRLSAMLESEVANMVDKAVRFEDSPSGDWIDNALLVAHKEGAPGKYQRCKEAIRLATDTQSGTYRVKYPVFSSAYGSAGATNQNVIDAIDAGQLVVNYRGHGSSTSWWEWNTDEQSFTTLDVANLSNGAETPVVMSIACNNNMLDEVMDCLGEAFTKEVDAAVAFLGSSRSSYTNANHTYDKQLFATIFDEGTKNIGNASNVAAIRMMQQHGGAGEDNAKMYLWLGDPSLSLPIEPSLVAYHWLVVVDTTGSMAGERLDRTKAWARTKVQTILTDPNDVIALATFAGEAQFTLHEDWTRDEEALLNCIDRFLADGLTPLADAFCAAADKLEADVPDVSARRLIFLTDGGENHSSGICAGGEDPDPNPPWCNDPISWHCNVWNALLEKMVVDIGYFGGIGAMRMSPDAMAVVSADGLDEIFFEDLADSTGGYYYDPIALCGNGILDPGEQCESGYPCLGIDSPGGGYTCVNCQCLKEVPAVSHLGVMSLIALLVFFGLAFILLRRYALKQA